MDKKDILSKFSVALAISRGKSLDPGIAPFQNADLLIKLRNAVVHFRSEWFSEQVEHAKLSEKLMPKFGGSPFLPGESLFPRAWASGEFAEWALRSTVAFLEHFYGEAAIECPIAKAKTRLGQLSGIAL